MQLLDSLRRGELTGTLRLDLNDAGLTELPSEVLSLADSLEVLNVSGNQITNLPDWLGRMTRLKVVFASFNPVQTLPPVLGSLPALEVIGLRRCGMTQVPAESLPASLRALILTDNAIATLPDQLGELPCLEKLMMTGNRLAALPGSLQGAKHLELLRLAANPLPALPDWLPTMSGLVWLAVAGTGALSQSRATSQSSEGRLAQIALDQLEIGEVLGQGASGHIYRVVLRSAVEGIGPAGLALAMKRFKGPMTSDGRPEDEVRAHRLTGAHPNLVSAVAAVTGDTESSDSLLMPLLPPALKVLAGPPSLDSCTRDCFADGVTLDAQAALRLLSDVAGAVVHLHSQGLLHGDLYAHNVLYDPSTGQAWLSDLGAAAWLPQSVAGGRLAWQSLDIRAFGVLVEEVVSCIGAASEEAITDALRDVVSLCRQAGMQERPRPSMQDVKDMLAGMMR